MYKRKWKVCSLKLKEDFKEVNTRNILKINGERDTNVHTYYAETEME